MTSSVSRQRRGTDICTHGDESVDPAVAAYAGRNELADRSGVRKIVVNRAGRPALCLDRCDGASQRSVVDVPTISRAPSAASRVAVAAPIPIAPDATTIRRPFSPRMQRPSR